MLKKINDHAGKIFGRIDSSNAGQLEAELMEAFEGSGTDVTLDADELEYISSAGLRVLLKLKKSVFGELCMTNVSGPVYEILEVTGFTQFLKVCKKLREVCVEGCQMIGQGAMGKVYRLDEETIIKVFEKGIPEEVVRQERDYARTAFVSGIPTAIAYDVVRCGECFGAVYEMLHADMVSDVIREHPERAAELGARMGKLLKQFHDTEADRRVFGNVKDLYKERVGRLAKYLTEEETAKLMRIYEILPEKNTLVHGDFHMKNVMLMGDELIFIDMGDVGYGHPLLDFGSSCQVMVNVPRMFPEKCEQFIGISRKLCDLIWEQMLKAYFETEDVSEHMRVIQIYGDARLTLMPVLIPYADEARKKMIVEGMRAKGLLAKDYDLSALEKLPELFS